MGVSLRVDGGNLAVRRGRSGQRLANAPLEDLFDVKIDTATYEDAHATRAFSIRQRTHAGFALGRLGVVLKQVNPRADHQGDWQEYIEGHLVDAIGQPKDIHQLVHGSTAYDGDLERRRERIDGVLRAEVGRVCREVRRRIGATRSRVALVEAFALRCSWYDAAAMARLAKRVAGKGQAKEDPLSDHLARFLFDHGLRPLTRATVGRLIPDAFDPSPRAFANHRESMTEPAFYVEAKQYVDVKGARKAIRDGSRQVWNTADRIRKRYALDEAFLVFFRRGGPHLVFPPEEVRAGGLVVRPVLVDVAPGRVSGSKAQPVIHVTEAQLLASLPTRADRRRSGGRKPAAMRSRRAQASRDEIAAGAFHHEGEEASLTIGGP